MATGKSKTEKGDTKHTIPLVVTMCSLFLILSGVSAYYHGPSINTFIQRQISPQSDDYSFFEDYRVRYYMGDFYDKQIIINKSEILNDQNKDMMRVRVIEYKNFHLLVQSPKKYRNDPSIANQPWYLRGAAEFMRKFTTKNCNTFLAIFRDYFSNQHTSNLPILVKSRMLNTKYGILWPFNYLRHWKHVKIIDALDIDWKQKENKVVYRGNEFTGSMDKDNGHSHDMRLTLVEQYAHQNYTNFDIGHSRDKKMIKHRPDIYNDERYQRSKKFEKGKLSISQQLKAKYIVSIEGNDVASGLQWQLYSKSVVLMPMPLCESWTMHGEMKPFEHFVPLVFDEKERKWDLEEKFNWCVENDAKCRKIGENGRKWIQRLIDPNREYYVKQKIMERYCENFKFVE